MSAQVAADLRAAADVLERDGWTQRAWLDAGCRCAASAITKVALTATEGDEFDFRYEAAADAFSRHIRAAIIPWNDAPGRTADEVIAALRAAADRAEASA